MSYNLLIEGALDYEELALTAARLQALELFPDRGRQDGGSSRWQPRNSDST